MCGWVETNAKPCKGGQLKILSTKNNKKAEKINSMKDFMSELIFLTIFSFMYVHSQATKMIWYEWKIYHSQHMDIMANQALHVFANNPIELAPD